MFLFRVRFRSSFARANGHETDPQEAHGHFVGIQRVSELDVHSSCEA